MKALAQVALFLFLNVVSAQNRYENEAYGFSIDEPEGWIWASNEDLKQNLGKLDLDDKKLLKIISDHKGSLLLLSMYKYDPMTHSGLIPAIQINVREKRNKDFEVFKSYMHKSALSLKDIYTDYEFIDEPKEIKINRIKSLYFSGKFTMKTQTGVEHRVRNRVYIIPHESYYFQVTFTDGMLTEDCTELYEKLLKTIKIKK